LMKANRNISSSSGKTDLFSFAVHIRSVFAT
jgi:hypothetical protein